MFVESVCVCVDKYGGTCTCARIITHSHKMLQGVALKAAHGGVAADGGSR